MKAISIPGLILLLVCLCASPVVQAQNTPTPPDEAARKLELLRTGMSEMKIREVAGLPSRVENYLTYSKVSKDTFTYWLYPNLWTVVLANHKFSHLEKDRTEFLFQIQQWANPKNKENIQLIYGR